MADKIIESGRTWKIVEINMGDGSHVYNVVNYREIKPRQRTIIYATSKNGANDIFTVLEDNAL